jgi:hypothetical protein
MRALVFAFALTTSGAALADVPPPMLLPSESPIEIKVIAELGVTGRLECNGFEPTWHDLVPLAGLTPVLTETPSRWLEHKGELVIFKATPSDKTPLVGPPPEPCLPEQARSDWLYTALGYVTRRAELEAPFPALAATDFKPWQGLSMKRRGDRVDVRLDNRDIGLPLKGVTLVAHYEGCYGKPGTTSKPSEAFDLALDKHKTVTFPAFLEEVGYAKGTRHQTHRLAEVQVRSASGRVLFLVSRDVSALGVDIACSH